MLKINFNVIDNVKGKKTISDDAAKKLSEIESQIDELTSDKNELRKLILDAMIENNVDKCICSNGTTFSQIIPSKIVTFDNDSFIMNESEDVVRCFTTFDEIKTFNEEKFKAENPDLYNKYVETSIETNIDTNKLVKTLPNIYKKYATEKDSDKPVTLRVGKKRVSK